MRPSRRITKFLSVQEALLVYPETEKLCIISPMLRRRIFASFPSNQLLKGSTRAYFILESSRYLQHSPTRHAPSFHEAIQETDVLNLLLIGEMVITIMYLINHRLDGKLEVTTTEARVANELEQMMLQQALDRFIMEHFSSSQQAMIQQKIAKLFRLYHQGNLIDQEELNWDSWQANRKEGYHIGEEAEVFVNVEEMARFLQQSIRKQHHVPVRQAEYLKTYLTRSYLINGLFFQTFADILIEWHQPEAQVQREIRSFARWFGTLQQLVNDTTDYVLVNDSLGTTCKLPSDTFSDARRGMITLPIAYALSQKERPMEIRTHYERGSWTERLTQSNFQQTFLQHLHASHGLSQAMSMGAAVAKHAPLSLNPNNPVFTNLKEMCEIGLHNQLYQQMNQYKSSHLIKVS